MKAILKIAKEGYDCLLTSLKNLSLNSEDLLPKICVEKDLPTFSGVSSGDAEFEHNLGYPPLFLSYRDNENQLPSFSADRYSFNKGVVIFEGEASMVTVGETDFKCTNFVKNSCPLILFLDPLASPSSSKPPTKSSRPVLKVGTNLVTNADRENSFDSRFDTLKVYEQGDLVLTVPEETITYAQGTQNYEVATVPHNLGYPPAYAPFVNFIHITRYYETEANIPSSFVLNDLEDAWPKTYSYSYGGVDLAELAWIEVDSDNLYLSYQRYVANNTITSYTFPGREVTLKYIIFANNLKADFNLLE